MMPGQREDGVLEVRLPPHLPALTTNMCRALLAILVELTTVEVLDGPSEDVCRDY
ncbi:hypothetical protein GCM10023148_00420 [Actinokineospora soli]